MTKAKANYGQNATTAKIQNYRFIVKFLNRPRKTTYILPIILLLRTNHKIQIITKFLISDVRNQNLLFTGTTATQAIILDFLEMPADFRFEKISTYK